MKFLHDMVSKFDVAIYSTRCHQWLGQWAMKTWLREHLYTYIYEWASERGLLNHNFTHMDDEDEVSIMVDEVMRKLSFPKRKPPALVYIDDRAWRFEGVFPTADEVHRARPWNKPAQDVL